MRLPFEFQSEPESMIAAVMMAPSICSLRRQQRCKNAVSAVQVAVDLDPVAVDATCRNAALNGVGHACTCLVCGPTASDPDPLAACEPPLPQSFDICLANVLKPALLDLRLRLTSYVRPGGRLVLSGMLENQVCFLAWHGMCLLAWHVGEPGVLFAGVTGGLLLLLFTRGHADLDAAYRAGPTLGWHTHTHLRNPV
jgi:Ribosomal protein L11 methyltransferase (PrmA)